MSDTSETKVPSSSESNEPKVPGLSTPALTNGEFIDASSEIPSKAEDSEGQNLSIIEIASELEGNIKKMMDMMEKNDKEVNQRLDDLADRIELLRRKCATTSLEK